MSTVTEADWQAAGKLYVAIYGHRPLNSDCDRTIVAMYAQNLAAAREAGERAGAERERLDMDDETLVAEIAFDIGQATKTQPTMDGRCRRLHGDAENRRIARAAIRAINRLEAVAARRRP